MKTKIRDDALNSTKHFDLDSEKVKRTAEDACIKLEYLREVWNYLFENNWQPNEGICVQ